jgi:predicted AlkP superfamily pyrophosphatase or phosphodiesterase
MKTSAWLLPLAILISAAPSEAPPRPAAPASPKLVLLIAVDQLRYDYLTRFRADFTGGFDRLLRQGAVFTNAQLEHYPTVTAVGHATMLSGAPPSLSGIIGNDWYDRETRRNVTSVGDPEVSLLGGEGKSESGASPRRLLVSTLGDELKMAGRSSRVIGASLKDRSAILSVGRMADGAFWFDAWTGAFVSSTWYFGTLPTWVASFDRERRVDAYAGREWAGGRLPATPGAQLNLAVYESPFGNELLSAFAQAALAGERLGQRGATDVLSVSFSSNDAVGHAKGPEAPEVAAITKETDRVLGELLQAVDRQVGLAQTLVVLTADHGVAPVPEAMAARRMPGGRFQRDDLVSPIAAALEKAFGPGQWIEGRAGSSLYLNRSLVAEKKLSEREVQEKAATAAQALKPVWRVLTRDQLLHGQVPDDPWSRRVLRSFNPHRSGDVEILLEPYWIGGESAATHGTPYSYDAHIPLVLMGPGLRPGRFDAAVALNDLAPTLASLLDVETPSGSSGRVLVEALAPR